MPRAYISTAERALGHKLPHGAVVHHVDQNRKNGRNDNLVILASCAEHRALHQRLRVLRAGGDPWTQQICCTCAQLKALEHFKGSSTSYSGYRSQCKKCHAVEVLGAKNIKHGRPYDYRESTEERSKRYQSMANRRWEAHRAPMAV